MLFEKTILEKAEYQKFVMFRILKSFEGSSYTIIDIANEMKISYQQTYNILQELLEDIQNFPDADLKDLNRKKIMSSKKIPLSIDMYRLFLLKRSPVFQFIDYVFQSGNNINVEKFCDEHYISRSTLLRKNASLKLLLAKYKLKISYNELGFIGDEKNIRFFFYCFYWLSYRGIEWPFENIHYYEVAKKLKLEKSELNDPIVTIRTILFWTICRIRIIDGYYVSGMNKFDEIFPDLTQLFDNQEVFTTATFPRLDPSQLITEYKFFDFYRLQSIIFPTTGDNFSSKIYKAQEQQKTPIWYLTQDFMNDVNKHLINQSDDQFLVQNTGLQANLMRVFFSYYVMNGDYPQFNDFYEDESGINYQNSIIKQLVKTFINQKVKNAEFQPYLQLTEKIINEVSSLLIPYLRYFKANETVKIKLVLESSDLITRDMMTFLGDLSFVQIVPESGDLQNVDVIITTLASLSALYDENELQNKIIINWNLDATEAEYFNLYQTLKQEFTKKITS